MNRRDLQNAFGPVPDDFRTRVDETLNRLEEREMRRRTKFATTLVAAVLITALLAGAAVAVSNLDIWQALNYAEPIIPLESADELVATDLAAAENDYFRVIVQEGVYDGYGAIVKLRFEPKDPERYAIITDFAIAEDLGDQCISEVVREYENGSRDVRITGRRDGKEIIFLSTPRLSVSGEFPNADSLGLAHLFNSYMDQYNEDGSAEFWISGSYARDLPETLKVTLSARGMNADAEAVYGRIEKLTFNLMKNNKERVVRLRPIEDSRIDGFELLDAKISFTEVRGYISVEYAGYASEYDQGSGISLRLLDAQGNEFTTGSGGCFENENGRYRWELEMQTFEEIPETMILEVHRIGEKALGQIECRVEPVDD